MKYQGGPKEGLPLDKDAVDFFVRLIGYNQTDPRWGNYHDVELEKLSDEVNSIKLLFGEG